MTFQEFADRISRLTPDLAARLLNELTTEQIEKLEEAESAPEPAPESLFYIQNRGYCGNCLLWWRIDGQGYTCNLDEAWKVPRASAEGVCRSRPHQDVMWPVNTIDQHAERHVNCERMSAAQHGTDDDHDGTR